MLEDVLDCDSIIGIRVQQFANKVLDWLTHVVGKFEFTFSNFQESILDTWALKRWRACQKGIEYAANAPKICLEPIWLAVEHLWCDVIGCAAQCLLLALFSDFKFHSESKIDDLHRFRCMRDQNIAQLQVPMHDPKALHMLDSARNLPKDLAYLSLWQPQLLCLLLLDQLIQLLAITVLHEKINVLLIFKTMVQAYNRIVLHLCSVLGVFLYQLKLSVEHNMYFNFIFDSSFKSFLFDFVLVYHFQSKLLSLMIGIPGPHSVDVGSSSSAKLAQHLIV